MENIDNYLLNDWFLLLGAHLSIIPIDYNSFNGSRIHSLDNIEWYLNDSLIKAISLRKYIKNTLDGNISLILTKTLNDKVQIKTYLTDRAQTGAYQTNREKRWECHPQSVQFSFRRSGWEIESKLMEQVFYFKDFPELVKELAVEEGIIEAKEDYTVCPITLEPLSFTEFSDEILNKQHGRSCFQVGHLNPLKSTETEEAEFGHTAQNISWLSDQGNRIQGDLSLNEIRTMIKGIAKRYDDSDI